MDERLIEVVEQNEALLMANRIDAIREAAKSPMLVPNEICQNCGTAFPKKEMNAWKPGLTCSLDVAR